jgi:hypothetical protein
MVPQFAACGAILNGLRHPLAALESGAPQRADRDVATANTWDGRPGRDAHQMEQTKQQRRARGAYTAEWRSPDGACERDIL